MRTLATLGGCTIFTGHTGLIVVFVVCWLKYAFVTQISLTIYFSLHKYITIRDEGA